MIEITLCLMKALHYWIGLKTTFPEQPSDDKLFTRLSLHSHLDNTCCISFFVTRKSNYSVPFFFNLAWVDLGPLQNLKWSPLLQKLTTASHYYIPRIPKISKNCLKFLKSF